VRHLATTLRSLDVDFESINAAHALFSNSNDTRHIKVNQRPGLLEIDALRKTIGT
jgi:hypothetical protein